MSPFSGISLIIHLAIIGTGKVISFFRKPNPGRRRRREGEPSRLRAGINQALAIAIVLSVFVLMLGSFARAVKTGLREGSQEPQVKFVRKHVAAMRRIVWQGVRPFNEVEAQRSEITDTLFESFLRP